MQKAGKKISSERFLKSVKRFLDKKREKQKNLEPHSDAIRKVKALARYRWQQYFEQPVWPRPWFLAIAGLIHIVALWLILLIPPIVFEAPKIVPIHIIEEKPPIEKVEVNPVLPKNMVQQPQTQINQNQTKHEENIAKLPEAKLEKAPPIVQPKAETQNQTERAEEIPSQNYTFDDFKTKKNLKISSPVKNPQKIQKIDASEIQNTNPSKIRVLEDLPPSQAKPIAPIKATNVKTKLKNPKLEETKKIQELVEEANTAPKAENGELAPSANVSASSGVTSLGGAGNLPVLPAAPNGGGATRGGSKVGNGNGEGGFLQKMARSSECAEISRKRDEKCPDWKPLEGNHRKIPTPIPKGYDPPEIPKNPHEPCLPGNPHSNLGRECLPDKHPPNEQQRRGM